MTATESVQALRDAFLENIADRPTRLIYADALEESGHTSEEKLARLRSEDPFDWPDVWDEFTEAYIECALWADHDSWDPENDDGRSWDYNGYSRQDIELSCLASIVRDCRKFQADNETDLSDLDLEDCGWDFFLSRNGHGAGFFDRGYGEQGDRLQEAARRYGEFYLEMIPHPPTEPSDDDLVTSDYRRFYQSGKLAFRVAVGERWEDAVIAHEQETEYFPNVWLEGERGDYQLLILDVSEDGTVTQRPW